MSKTMPPIPQPSDAELLLPFGPFSQRPGIFGASVRPSQSLIPETAASTLYPFSAGPSDFNPQAIANMVRNSPAAPPLTIRAWAQTAGRNALPSGADIQFSAADGSPAKPATTHQLPREIIAAAQVSQRRTGVPASAIIAQWIWESAREKRIPPNSNNYFGIKEYDKRKPSVTSRTKEGNIKTGQLASRNEPFRVFATAEDSWIAHGRLLSADPRYAKAMSLANDPDKFVDAIAETYAPGNRNYAKNIKNTMRHDHLYQYNILPPLQN